MRVLSVLALLLCGAAAALAQPHVPESCLTLPSYPDPSGSVGWSDNNCYTFNGNYECVAPCTSGYDPRVNIPKIVCSGSTGKWGPVTGSCETVENMCSITPPCQPGSGSLGWSGAWCDETPDGKYTCQAYCKSGYVQGPGGVPTATCDTATGGWTDVSGSCVRAGPDCPSCPSSNPCQGYPSYAAPQNSLGWSSKRCYTTGLGPGVTTTCLATCCSGYVSSNGNDTEPSSTCDWNTGKWSAVDGSCEPANSPDCSSGYPDIPDPPNTSGWKCYSSGYSYHSQRICSAACQPGFYAHPCEPTVTCAGDGSWTQVRGGCVPYKEPAKPCYGYPGGKPSCWGGAGHGWGKWKRNCGGSGICYKSRTWAKNCGKKCLSYCPSSVKHNTRCEASCGSGYKGGYYSKCVNGEWTNIGGGCYN